RGGDELDAVVRLRPDLAEEDVARGQGDLDVFRIGLGRSAGTAAVEHDLDDVRRLEGAVLAAQVDVVDRHLLAGAGQGHLAGVDRGVSGGDDRGAAGPGLLQEGREGG